MVHTKYVDIPVFPLLSSVNPNCKPKPKGTYSIAKYVH